jgi:hypothetical protein
MSTLNSFLLLSGLDLQLLRPRTHIGVRLDMSEALQVLRILTAVRFADPVSVFNRLALSDAIYILESQLLHAQNSQNGGLSPEFSPAVEEAFWFAAFLYIDMVLREMRSINIGGLVRRLVAVLRTASGDSISKASLGIGEDFLLWVLFIGGVASRNTEDRQFFILGLGRLCQLKHLRSHVEFEEAVDKVGLGLHSFGTQSAELWTEALLL